MAFNEKINLDELYSTQKSIEDNKIKIYNKILARVHKKIKVTSKSRNCDKHCFFLVPEFILGIPMYDTTTCITYIIDKLLDNGFHVVRITNLDQSLDPARLEYQIYNENDLNSREHSGFVDDPDVYGVVGSNVSFHDRDAGYSVTQGDYFVIDSETIGSKDGTWSMKLIDQSSNRLLFDVKLILIED